MSDDWEYDVALSYAGQDRPLVEDVAEALRARSCAVYYDRKMQADMWGKDLYQHLTDVYLNKARYCVVFISEHYERERWPRHELRVAQARAFREKNEYILPIRIDSTEIPGILPTAAYLDFRELNAEEVAEAILSKLGVTPQAPFRERQGRGATNPTVRVDTERDLASPVWLQQAAEQVNAQKYDEASVTISLNDPDSAVRQADVVEILNAIAAGYKKWRRWNSAVQALDRAQELSGSRAHYDRARTELLAEASQAMERAAALKRTASTHIEAGHYGSASQFLVQADGLDPEDPEIAELLAAVDRRQSIDALAERVRTAVPAENWALIFRLLDGRIGGPDTQDKLLADRIWAATGRTGVDLLGEARLQLLRKEHLKPEKTSTIQHKRSVPYKLRFSGDGRRLVVCASDRRVYVWWAEGRLSEDGLLTYYKVSSSWSSARTASAVFDSDDSRITTSAGSTEIHGYVIGRSTPRWVRQSSHNVSALAPMFRGWFGVACGRSVEIRELDSGHARRSGFLHPARVVDLAFSGTRGEILLTACADDRLRLWSVEPEGMLVEQRAPAPIAGLAPDAEVRSIVALLTDGRVVCWPIFEELTPPNVLALDGSTTAVDLSSDGRTLLAGSRSGTSLLFDVQCNVVLREVHQSNSAITAVRFAPDSGRIAVADAAGSIHVYDLQDERLYSLSGPDREIQLTGINEPNDLRGLRETLLGPRHATRQKDSQRPHAPTDNSEPSDP